MKRRTLLATALVAAAGIFAAPAFAAFPDKPVTEKPAETRMGSGKGSPEYWVAVVKPGRVLFEIAGVEEEEAHEALRLAMHKLPLKCKVVKKEIEKGGETDEGK